MQVIGGILLVGALFFPWTGEGPGSTLPAHRVGQLLASGVLDAVIPQWSAVLLYAGPLGGALAALAVGLTGRVRLWSTAAAVVLIALTAVPALALARAAPVGPGLMLTLAGSGSVVASMLARPRTR